MNTNKRDLYEQYLYQIEVNRDLQLECRLSDFNFPAVFDSPLVAAHIGWSNNPARIVMKFRFADRTACEYPVQEEGNVLYVDLNINGHNFGEEYNKVVLNPFE